MARLNLIRSASRKLPVLGKVTTRYSNTIRGDSLSVVGVRADSHRHTTCNISSMSVLNKETLRHVDVSSTSNISHLLVKPLYAQVSLGNSQNECYLQVNNALPVALPSYHASLLMD